MKRKRKLTKTIQLWGIILIITVFCSAVLLDILRSNQSFKRNSEQIRSENIAYQQKILIQEVDHAMDLINYSKSQSKKILKADVKARVYEAYAIAENIYLNNKNRYSSPEIQAIILDALSPIRFANGSGYYFISRLDDTAMLHAQQPALKGDNALSTNNSEGKYIIQDLGVIAQQSGEGFYEYTWSKPGATGQNHKKISFVKYFKPFNFYIGTGLYVQDMEEQIQKQLLESIGQIRFGAKHDGYLFVVSYDGTTLMDGTQRQLIGKNFWALTDPNGVKVIQEARKAVRNPKGGFINYTWNKPSTRHPSPKTSFVQGVEDWQWMVGAGVYLDDIEEEISLMQEKMYRQNRKKVVLFALLSLTLIAMFLLLFSRLNHKLNNDTHLLLSFFKQAAFANEPIDLKAVYFEELEQMARDANKMLADKIEAQQTLISEKERALENELNLIDAQKIAKIGSWHRNFLENKMLWSDELYRIVGLHKHAFKPDNEAYLQLLHPDDLENYIQLTSDAIHNSNSYEISYRILRPTGECIFVVERGEVQLDTHHKPVRLTGTIQDVTALKQLEKDQTLLVTAIDQASESIIITDIDGNIQYVNPSFEQLTGYSSDEVLGKNPRILNSGLQDLNFYKQLWSTLLQGKVWHGRLSNQKKDGTLFEEEATLSPIKDEHGRIINFVAVKRDVSKEVLLEKQLRQAVKMEAIGTLAGGIAHDFNNILAAILGYGEMAKTQLPEESLARKDIEQVIRAGNRAKNLVKQILTFSRQGEEAFSPLQLPPLVKEALQLLHSSLPTTIQIQKQIDDNCPAILADATQIHQVLMNICTNAKHAMDRSGGILTVALSKITVTELGDIPACPQLEKGTYLDLSIRDTGCGMNTVTQANIFNPFFTTKEVGKGTGLGLAVVHGIIKQHHGAISVESTLGKGSLFHIYLPALKQKILPATSAIPTRLLPQGTEHILVVDDEEAITCLIQRMLTDLGYNVTTLNNSIQALNTINTSSDTFDILITDMTMPGMTGATLAEKILAHKPGFPIILCTGFSETMDSEQAKSLGIREFIMKPILKEQLAITLRKVLDHG